MFDSEVFVADCRRAAGEGDPVSALAEVVAAAIRDGGAIDARLGTEVKDADTLFSSPELTVQPTLAFRAMLLAIREVAAEHRRAISDDDRFDAMIAVRAAYRRQRRYLSPEEARRVVAKAWGIIA